MYIRKNKSVMITKFVVLIILLVAAILLILHLIKKPHKIDDPLHPGKYIKINSIFENFKDKLRMNNNEVID